MAIDGIVVGFVRGDELMPEFASPGKPDPEYLPILNEIGEVIGEVRDGVITLKEIDS